MAFEGLTAKLNAAFKKLRGKGRLSESDIKEAMREIRLALLEADVSYKFVKDFVKSVSERCVGRDVSTGTVLQRIKNGLTILSIVITWALENAIETADSMRSRGYGMAGRTAFSIYRLQRRDIYALIFLILASGYVIAGSATGGIYWQYYPLASGQLTGFYTISVFAVYLALCLIPLMINLWEEVKWKSLTSKI